MTTVGVGTRPRWLPGAGGEPDGFRERPGAEDLARLSTGVDDGMPEDRALPLPYAVHASADHLRRTGTELRRMPVDARIAAIARVARSWRDPDDALRRTAMDVLPDELGFTPEMVAWALDAAFEVVTAEALRAWWGRVTAARGDGDDGGGGGDGGAGHAGAVGLSGHIWAGNVFVAGLPPVLGSVLAGVPALIKAPVAHPTFAALLARSFVEHAPELGPCVGAAAWSREETQSTAGLLRADAVFVFGDDASVEAVREAAPPPCAVYGFGHRVSVGLIRGAVADEDLVGLWEDHLAYDGGGCLTPKWVFVEGSMDDAVALAKRAAALGPEVAARMPARPLDDAAAAARVQLLGIAEFDGFGAAGTGWCAVAVDGVPPTTQRTLCVCPAERLDALPSQFGDAWWPALQGAVVLGTSEDEETALRASGISYIARPGRLQRPPLDWDHDGVAILEALRG